MESRWLENLYGKFVSSYPFLPCQPCIVDSSIEVVVVQSWYFMLLLYSLRPKKNAILVFRRVKWFELIKIIQKVLTFIIQNKYHYINYEMYFHNKLIWRHYKFGQTRACLTDTNLIVTFFLGRREYWVPILQSLLKLVNFLAAKLVELKSYLVICYEYLEIVLLMIVVRTLFMDREMAHHF